MNSDDDSEKVESDAEWLEEPERAVTAEETDNVDDDDSVPWYIRVMQIVIAFAGLGAAITRAFLHRENYESWPNLDVTTMGWLGVALIGVLLPSISEIKLGGVSIKTKQLKRATRIYETTLDSLANLVQNWSTASALFVAQMESVPEDLLEAKADIYAAYIRDRVGEAYEMLATRKDEKIRIGIWFYRPTKKKLVFTYGFARGIRSRPKRNEYDPGQGMLGRSFVENRHFNEADVRNVPSYESSREEDDEPPYRAVLCEPIRWLGNPIGIVTVDRSTIGFFDQFAVEIVRGLCAQCALAFKAFEIFGEVD